MPRPDLERKLAQDGLHVAVLESFGTYLEVACSGQLPDVELSSAGLEIIPLENTVPKETDA